MCLETPWILPMEFSFSCGTQIHLRGMPVVILLTLGDGRWTMENGTCCLGHAPAPNNYCRGASGFGNGEWRRSSLTASQLPVPPDPVLTSMTQ